MAVPLTRPDPILQLGSAAEIGAGRGAGLDPPDISTLRTGGYFNLDATERCRKKHYAADKNRGAR